MAIEGYGFRSGLRCDPSRHGGLAPFQRLGGRVLIALDGTEYFCSQKLGCPQCLTRRRANGKVESYHATLAATLVAPGHAMSRDPLGSPALPLMPEFIAPRTARKSGAASAGNREVA